MAARLVRSLVSALLLTIGVSAFAQNEVVLFEDTFTGADGTVVPTGTEENYHIYERTNVVLTPTVQGNKLQLAIGPNLNDAGGSFGYFGRNGAFDFTAQPLLFEVDVEMGDAVTMAFGIHSWMGDNRLDSPNHLVVSFYNGGTRLLLTGKKNNVATSARHEITGFSETDFRLGLYVDGTTVKLFVNEVEVYSGLHELEGSTLAGRAYLGLQLNGGGGTTHSTTFDNIRITANPDLTPKPTVLYSETFSGEDGELAESDIDDFTVASRTGAVLGIAREAEQLKLSMGPNTSGANTYSMVYTDTRYRFDVTPHLFEMDVDPQDMPVVAVALRDRLNTDIFIYGDNASAVLYGDRRMVFETRASSDPTAARWDSEVGAFLNRKYRVGFYVDATDIKFLIDGEVIYSGPHNFAQKFLDEGAYFGVSINGGGEGVQSATFDNVVVTANPDITPPEVVPGDIFWTTATAIRSASFDGSDVRTVVGSLGRPIGLAIDFENDQMFWVEHDTGLLMTADTTGANVTELRSDLQTGQFVTLDATAGQLYWTEWLGGVHTSPIDGSARDNLFASPANGNAGVTISGDTVFLVSATDGTVTSYELGGSGTPESVTTFGEATYSIAVDPSGRELFATNFNDGWIKAFDLQAGGEPRTVWDAGLSRPLGITVSADGEKLYWVERTTDVANGRIRVANLDGSGSVVTLVEGEASPFGIAVRPEGGAASGFTAWINGFGLDEGEMGMNDSPAGDGVPNLLKYALGLNPSQSARDALPQPSVVEVDGNRYLTLSVERNRDATGFTWLFEVSSDLVTWSSSASDVVVTESGSTITAASVTPIEDGERMFMRVRLVAE